MVPDLPTGTYRVTCDAPGFKKEVVDNNLLLTNLSLEVSCQLQVGTQTDSVWRMPCSATSSNTRNTAGLGRDGIVSGRSSLTYKTTGKSAAV